jgi:hypothetical protein
MLWGVRDVDHVGSGYELLGPEVKVHGGCPWAKHSVVLTMGQTPMLYVV